MFPLPRRKGCCAMANRHACMCQREVDGTYRYVGNTTNLKGLQKNLARHSHPDLRLPLLHRSVYVPVHKRLELADLPLRRRVGQPLAALLDLAVMPPASP